MSCYISGGSTKLSFDSQGEQLPSLAVLQTLLIMPVLGFSDSQSQLYLTISQAD